MCFLFYNLLLVQLLGLLTTTTHAFFAWPNRKATTTILFPKRSRGKSNNNYDDMNQWYDDVDENATPDDVFWEEQERQRLLNKLGGDPYVTPPSAVDQKSAMQEFQMNQKASAMQQEEQYPKSGATAFPPYATASTVEQQMEFQRAQRTTEATLQEYEAFRVSDNWINSKYKALYQVEEEYEELDLDEQDRRINEEFEELQKSGGPSNNSKKQPEFKIADAWMNDAEPWDLYGQPRDVDDEERGNALKIERDPNNEFEMDYDEVDDGVKEEEEDIKWEQKMANCQVTSKRLEKARTNPAKAEPYFQRPPDDLQGYDTMWVCAIDNACYKNLAGVFCNYGIQFADNFGDYVNMAPDDEKFSIDDLACYKARQIYDVTGLPVIASQTSFEIEPVPSVNNNNNNNNHNNNKNTKGMTNSRQPNTNNNNNPRVSSGYWFNTINENVDYMIEALKPVSAPNRRTLWRTCLCYYDGEVELYEFSSLECDIHWATSLRTFIPVCQAINQICKTLQLTFGLEYMKWLTTAQSASAMSRTGRGTAQLRDRVLKDGKVLPNNIIDVSAFMDSMVDVNLMDDCAQELSERFLEYKPTKILTVATTGLVLALPLAKYLQIPVVYARKERNAVMADTYTASYRSQTVGKEGLLLVSKSHLVEEDRILVVDDFLSSGAAQEALLRIISDAGAKAVGIGVLLEKVYGKGRLFLSGFNLPIHSMCRVSSVQGGVIQVMEEEGDGDDETTVVY